MVDRSDGWLMGVSVQGCGISVHGLPHRTRCRVTLRTSPDTGSEGPGPTPREGAGANTALGNATALPGEARTRRTNQHQSWRRRHWSAHQPARVDTNARTSRKPTDQKVRGSNPFGRAPLTSTNTNQRTRSLTMWTESGPRANTALGRATAGVSAVPSRGPNRGHTLSRMSSSAGRCADQDGPAGTSRHHWRLTFRQVPVAQPAAQSMHHLRSDTRRRVPRPRGATRLARAWSVGGLRGRSSDVIAGPPGPQARRMTSRKMGDKPS